MNRPEKEEYPVSLLHDFLNETLFAPTRHIDNDGTPARGTLPYKILQTPKTKAGLLSATLVSCFFATASNEDMTKASLAALALFFTTQSALVAKQIYLPQTRKYYFDTKPDKPSDKIPVTILSDILTNRETLRRRLIEQTLITGAGGGAFYALTGNLPMTCLLTANFMSANLTGTYAKAWYANEVVTRSWNANFAPPPSGPRHP